MRLFLFFVTLTASTILVSSQEIDFGKIETNSYLISTGALDLERLTILNDLYNPSSLDFMKLEHGMSVLTLGCGIGLLEVEIAEKVENDGKVLATDISDLQLAIALKNKKLVNLTFQQLDIAKLDSITECFDRIHCRFVLSHFPWESIEKLLPLLLNKLTPTGALVIEEITTLDSLTCNPFSEEYELWKSYIKKQFNIQGSDPSPGKRLHTYLKTHGYSFDYNTYQPILKNQREKKILGLGIRSIASGLLNRKMATPEEIIESVEKLKILEDDSMLAPLYCQVSQFFIKPFPCQTTASKF